MPQEQQLRDHRQALNAALNDRDIDRVKSFLHPDFSVKGCREASINRDAMLEQMEHMLKSFKDFKSHVEVQQIEVEGDCATLSVSRLEAARMRNPQTLWGLLAAAAVFLGLAVFHIVQGYRVDVPPTINGTVVVEQEDEVDVGPIVSAAMSEEAIRGIRASLTNATIYANGTLLFIGLSFFIGRRTFWQTQRARETWRCVDGGWLLAEEEPLS